MEEVDLKFVDELVRRLGAGRRMLIPLLQGIQEHYRWLPEAALRRLCELTEITPAEAVGVASFYDFFRHSPAGRHVVRICHGTACHVKGAQLVHDALLRELAIPEGADTDPAGEFTLQKVACLGCCTLAPVVQIDQVTYGHLTPEKVPRVLRDFLELETRRAAGKPHVPGAAAGGGKAEIRVGLGSCCVARGSGQVREALEAVLAANDIAATIKRVGCVGMCSQTPLVEIVPTDGPPHLYARVQAEDVEAIVLRHFRPRGLRRVTHAVSHALDKVLTDQAWTPVERYGLDTRDEPVAAFMGSQRHLATEACGQIDPTNLDEYRARGGFAALERCLRELSPDAVIDTVARAALRGRGGAGFPTADKWRAVRAAPTPDGSGLKYIVCNGDEGDPGAFMDRMILESYPYRVLEGMIIAAWAVGAREGWLYIRAEYPLAVQRVREALDRCRAAGLVGERILGTEFSLDLRIMEGAGAFVCGEETALLASIEGRRGMPRLRPPYPAQSGLWGLPTLVNNVETYALIGWIIRHGAQAFAELGSGRSRGTKVFALAGKVRRGGLIEVPMGISLGQIVEEIGGTPRQDRGPRTEDREPSGRRSSVIGLPGSGAEGFKAVQVGGPSGGCVPAELADTPVDYEALAGVGAIMGSGGLVVLGREDCMVDIARYFLQFTQEQSCGKCAPCRVGTRRMLDIMERLCAGTGQHGDLAELERLANSIRTSSLCGLGKTAPNPILSTLRFFRAEYEAHLAGKCPAGRCRALIHYRITDDCLGCTLCAQRCPASAIALRPYEKHEVDDATCIRCGTCRQVCPASAVVVE